MVLDGKVSDHIISNEAYHVMMTEEPVTYDTTVSGAGWNGYDYFNNGGATFPITRYYWENAPVFRPHKVDGHLLEFNPVFTSGPIPTLASTGTLPDGTIGDFDRPNPNPERTCTLDWNFGADKGCLFTLDQLKEFMASDAYKTSRDRALTLEQQLDRPFVGFHAGSQMCNKTGGWHISYSTAIVGVNYLYVPATGHVEYTLN